MKLVLLRFQVSPVDDERVLLMKRASIGVSSLIGVSLILIELFCYLSFFHHTTPHHTTPPPPPPTRHAPGVKKKKVKKNANISHRRGVGPTKHGGPLQARGIPL